MKDGNRISRNELIFRKSVKVLIVVSKAKIEAR